MLVPLIFVASIPTYFLNFNFLIILVCLLFIHASIHNNLSAGAQNVTGTGAYVIMLVYRRLLTLQALVNNALTWQSRCVIANNA